MGEDVLAKVEDALLEVEIESGGLADALGDVASIEDEAFG